MERNADNMPPVRGRGLRPLTPASLTGRVSRQGPRSSRVTSHPAFASRAAATEPPNPLPMTTARSGLRVLAGALFRIACDGPQSKAE